VESAATRASVIDRAVPSAVVTDWDGAARPTGAADVGADEFAATPAAPTPPPTPAPPAVPVEPTPPVPIVLPPAVPTALPPAAPLATPVTPTPAGPVLSAAVGGPLGLVFGVNSDGSVRFVKFAAWPGYAGRLSTAVADVSGDGVPDVVTGTTDGPGVVRVFDGIDGTELAAFLPFGATPVRVDARDVNGDGRADLFVAPGTLPVYAVFSGRDRSFLGIGLAGGVFVG
jgi:hypothetical protein